MSKLLVGLSLINRHFRCQSTLTQAKNVISCGVSIVHNYFNSALHGPTASQIMKDLDLSNKTCLITGANSGIGLEMTRCLNARGGTVLMLCRNKYAADLIARKICDNTQTLKVYETNLASLNSVKKCYEDILKNEKKIDIVILNAGVFGLPWTLTEDMLETTFQVNYLSQYYLLMNIEKILAPDARVVFVSSESHRNIKLSIRDQMIPSESTVSLPNHSYTSIKAYNMSKLCGLLCMHYFGQRWMNTGKQVFAAHPGSFVKTNLCRNWWPWETLYTAMLPFSKTIAQAASTPLYCATSPDLTGMSNLYFKDLKKCEESELAKDFNLAFRINDLTLDLLEDRTETTAIDGSAAEDITPTLTPQKHSTVETLTPEYSA